MLALLARFTGIVNYYPFTGVYHFLPVRPPPPLPPFTEHYGNLRHLQEITGVYKYLQEITGEYKHLQAFTEVNGNLRTFNGFPP